MRKILEEGWLGEDWATHLAPTRGEDIIRQAWEELHVSTAIIQIRLMADVVDTHKCRKVSEEDEDEARYSERAQRESERVSKSNLRHNNELDDSKLETPYREPEKMHARAEFTPRYQWISIDQEYQGISSHIPF